MSRLDTPVVLIIFNRADTAKRVLAEVARAKPTKLFVIADGPRADRPDEPAACEATRAVIDLVDWDCQVYKNYSEVNLGCGRRPATGIDWVFDRVEEAIILEDDCIPDPTFFRYCQELLARYRDEPRVMQIAGTNFARHQRQSSYSYTFTSHLACWGWATWRRAWAYHDMACASWPTLRNEKRLRDWMGNQMAANFYSRFFEIAYAERGDVDFWDYQWQLAVWSQGGLSISPSSNLISNIGFGSGATHTHGSADNRANLATAEIKFPLRHPPRIDRDLSADQQFIDEAVMPYLPRYETVLQEILQKMVRMLPSGVIVALKNLRDRIRD